MKLLGYKITFSEELVDNTLGFTCFIIAVIWVGGLIVGIANTMVTETSTFLFYYGLVSWILLALGILAIGGMYIANNITIEKAKRDEQEFRKSIE